MGRDRACDLLVRGSRLCALPVCRSERMGPTAGCGACGASGLQTERRFRLELAGGRRAGSTAGAAWRGWAQLPVVTDGAPHRTGEASVVDVELSRTRRRNDDDGPLARAARRFAAVRIGSEERSGDGRGVLRLVRGAWSCDGGSRDASTHASAAGWLYLGNAATRAPDALRGPRL